MIPFFLLKHYIMFVKIYHLSFLKKISKERVVGDVLLRSRGKLNFLCNSWCHTQFEIETKGSKHVVIWRNIFQKIKFKFKDLYSIDWNTCPSPLVWLAWPSSCLICVHISPFNLEGLHNLHIVISGGLVGIWLCAFSGWKDLYKSFLFLGGYDLQSNIPEFSIWEAHLQHTSEWLKIDN